MQSPKAGFAPLRRIHSLSPKIEAFVPRLTRNQVFEAALGLNLAERAEFLERLHAGAAAPLELSEEHKQIILTEIEAHRCDPVVAITREELMGKMRAALSD